MKVKMIVLAVIFLLTSASAIALDGSEPMPLCRPTATTTCPPPPPAV